MEARGCTSQECAENADGVQVREGAFDNGRNISGKPNADDPSGHVLAGVIGLGHCRYRDFRVTIQGYVSWTSDGGFHFPDA